MAYEQAPYGYDPQTGQPRTAPAQQPIGYDPQTGQPIYAAQQQPTGYDPQTGQPIYGAQQQPTGFDPQTGQPIYGAQPVQAQVIDPAVPYPRSGNDKTMLQIAFILNVVACVGWAFTIIGLAWAIPLTVISYKIYKGQKANTTGIGVAVLILMGIVAGVLMLVANKDE